MNVSGFEDRKVQLLKNPSGTYTEGQADTNGNQKVTSVASQATAVTPNDSTVLSATRGLYLGVSGNVVVTMANGSDATFVGLAAGVIHPISVTKVKATGTTATSILAVY